MKKTLVLYICVLQAICNLLYGCPLTIVNDDSEKRDFMVADKHKAAVVRYGKSSSIGSIGAPTTVVLYSARTKNGSDSFSAEYQLIEKECPPSMQKNKKSSSIALSKIAARAEADPNRQRYDSERFIVEKIEKTRKNNRS